MAAYLFHPSMYPSRFLLYHFAPIFLSFGLGLTSFAWFVLFLYLRYDCRLLILCFFMSIVVQVDSFP